jgi:UDP-2,4-diacetamido-2,4,6-trideoxy-beta-L-altropyranose hydrolase
MSAPRVLFVPAYSSRSGGGHLMRCLSLAAALGRRARPVFAVPPQAAPAIARFAAHPVEVVTCASAEAADAVVVDDYALDAQGERLLRGQARVLLAIDDLADRPHAAEVLVDPGYGRTAADYAGLVPEGATVLTGSDYALMRPAFASLRAGIGEVRPAVERVFVSFGLGDVGGVCGKALAAIRPILPGARFDVALGSGAASLPALERLAAEDPALTLHVDATDVARLMLAADIGVGAGGGATWERCCLGLPSAAVVVADNQRPVIEALAAREALLGVDMAQTGWETALQNAVRRLADRSLRRSLRRAAMAACDGRGAERVAEALLARLG